MMKPRPRAPHSPLPPGITGRRPLGRDLIRGENNRNGDGRQASCPCHRDKLSSLNSAAPGVFSGLADRKPPCGGANMSKPVIFTISAAWDDEASVWSGHCDDIPAAADAPTLDELLAKISAIALDLLPDNHPGVDPRELFLQITALREAEPAAV